jgi:hypothetical protein
VSRQHFRQQTVQLGLRGEDRHGLKRSGQHVTQQMALRRWPRVRLRAVGMLLAQWREAHYVAVRKAEIADLKAELNERVREEAKAASRGRSEAAR